MYKSGVKVWPTSECLNVWMSISECQSECENVNIRMSIWMSECQCVNIRISIYDQLHRSAQNMLILELFEVGGAVPPFKYVKHESYFFKFELHWPFFENWRFVLNEAPSHFLEKPVLITLKVAKILHPTRNLSSLLLCKYLIVKKTLTVSKYFYYL